MNLRTILEFLLVLVIFNSGSTLLTRNWDHNDYISTEITQDTASNIDKIVTNIHTFLPLMGNLERETLVLSSPGGSADAMHLIEQTFHHTGKTVDTYVPKFAASAAAYLFTTGKERMIEPDASLLFHEIRIFARINVLTELPITVTDAKELVKNADIAANSQIKEVWGKLDDETKQGIIQEARELLPVLIKEENQYEADLAGNLHWSAAELHDLLIKPNEDVVVTGVEAVKLGIATHLGYESTLHRMVRSTVSALKDLLPSIQMPQIKLSLVCR